MQDGRPSRRAWLSGAMGAIAASTIRGQENGRKPKIAAIFTELRHRSHAYNFLVNLMGRYLFNGEPVESGVEIASFYTDQFPAGDMARDVSSRFKIPLYSTIAEACCLGGKELAVDGVLLIGEHGDYPVNELGQRMYPRKEFFDRIVAVMRRSQRFVPIFNDKHLSYRWDWAKAMYDEARELGIPLMAGSSVPLAKRLPWFNFSGEIVKDAMSIHGGGLESYDFHALEVMQSFLESRQGGETGVSQVQVLKAEALGEWWMLARRRESKVREGPHYLIPEAMRAEQLAGFERQPRPSTLPRQNTDSKLPRHALLLTYKDGTRGTVLAIGSSSDRWNFACRLKGDAQPLATALYNGPWGNLCLFSALSHAIVHFFKSGQSPYPVERTLLVSGILDAAMHSHQAGGKPMDTPHLEFAYQPRDFSPFRENGRSWRIITKDTPQPLTFEPYRF